MRINSPSTFSNKLLKLKLIKTKIYKKDCIPTNFKIEDIEHRLKKGLALIYNYSYLNKKILFVVSFLSIAVKLSKILKNTKHMVLIKENWVANSITDEKKLKNKFDLIVLLNEPNNSTIELEIYKSNRVTISFETYLKTSTFNANYKIFGNFYFERKKIRENIFLSLLKTVLKKSKLVRKKMKRYFNKMKKQNRYQYSKNRSNYHYHKKNLK